MNFLGFKNNGNLSRLQSNGNPLNYQTVCRSGSSPIVVGGSSGASEASGGSPMNVDTNSQNNENGSEAS